MSVCVCCIMWFCLFVFSFKPLVGASYLAPKRDLRTSINFEFNINLFSVDLQKNLYFKLRLYADLMIKDVLTQ